MSRSIKIILAIAVVWSVTGKMYEVTQKMVYPLREDYTRITCVGPDGTWLTASRYEKERSSVMAGENPSVAEIQTMGQYYCDLSADEVEEMAPSGGTEVVWDCPPSTYDGDLYCGKYLKLSDGAHIPTKPYGEIAITLSVIAAGTLLVLTYIKRA